nr:hypothetical protein [Lachnospiraceae bacterium]
MGLYGKRSNKEKKDSSKAFIWGGMLFVVVGLLLIGFSVFYITTYDRVDGVVDVRKTGGRNRKVAYVTYEYNGELYEDKGLSYFNAFTMKDGKECAVYIKAEESEEPKTTYFAISILSILMGILLIKAYYMQKCERDRL